MSLDIFIKFRRVQKVDNCHLTIRKLAPDIPSEIPVHAGEQCSLRTTGVAWVSLEIPLKPILPLNQADPHLKSGIPLAASSFLGNPVLSVFLPTCYRFQAFPIRNSDPFAAWIPDTFNAEKAWLARSERHHPLSHFFIALGMLTLLRRENDRIIRLLQNLTPLVFHPAQQKYHISHRHRRDRSLKFERP